MEHGFKWEKPTTEAEDLIDPQNNNKNLNPLCFKYKGVPLPPELWKMSFNEKERYCYYEIRALELVKLMNCY